MPNAGEEGVMIETWEVRRNRKDAMKVSPAERRAAQERRASDPRALAPQTLPGGDPFQ
jgi:hypothetical protein